ncbi:hypothetical protein V6N11_017273 [Hibiscus sabdariffa]|uniref:RNase H type-1 domain-containing protein n=1 Tax=Hibiscus sabdariffa TaxID=183260 RepID=A0ABR2TXS9_9ROSI
MQARNVLTILDLFGSFSRHRVSQRKPQVYFSPNCDDTKCASISSLLGFQRVDTLGKYLGTPIIHGRQRCMDIEFILEEMCSRLSAWTAQTLSMEGRVTLAKLGPLRDHLQHLGPAGDTLSFSDLNDDHGYWDVQKLDGELKNGCALIFLPTIRCCLMGWLCLNVDGLVSNVTNYGTTRGLFRDSGRHWLQGFHKALGVTTSLQAELWSILLGLQVTWTNGFCSLFIQLDSLQAIQLIQDHTTASSSNPIVHAIHESTRRAWQTMFRWVPREANQAADALAK